MKEKIVIQADPDTQDLIPGYLEKRSKDIASLQEALAAQNYEQIQTLGHRMKGSGAGYGFEGITAVGAALEEAAKLKQALEVEKGIAELKDYLERVKVIYGE